MPYIHTKHIYTIEFGHMHSVFACRLDNCITMHSNWDGCNSEMANGKWTQLTYNSQHKYKKQKHAHISVSIYTFWTIVNGPLHAHERKQSSIFFLSQSIYHLTTSAQTQSLHNTAPYDTGFLETIPTIKYTIHIHNYTRFRWITHINSKKRERE